MTSSLVGSEMCIRDRVCMERRSASKFCRQGLTTKPLTPLPRVMMCSDLTCFPGAAGNFAAIPLAP
eukprot:12606637-Prorocentrum_lima.AAC.1